MTKQEEENYFSFVRAYRRICVEHSLFIDGDDQDEINVYILTPNSDRFKEQISELFCDDTEEEGGVR